MFIPAKKRPYRQKNKKKIKKKNTGKKNKKKKIPAKNKKLPHHKWHPHVPLRDHDPSIRASAVFR